MFSLDNLVKSLIALLAMGVLTAAVTWENSELTDDSRNSFYAAISGVDWKGMDMSDQQYTSSNCFTQTVAFSWIFQDINGLRQEQFCEDLVQPFQLIDWTIEQGGYQKTTTGMAAGFMVNGLRDRLLTGLSRKYESDRFKNFVRGQGKLVSMDDFNLGMIHNEIVLSYSKSATALKMFQGSCLITKHYRARWDTIRVEDQIIEWTVVKTTDVRDCNCRTDGVQYNIERSNLVLEFKLIGDFSRGINDMRFSAPQLPTIRSYRGQCCQGN